MRLMGLDVGDKTIGIAVSDMLGLTAQGLETIIRTSNKIAINRIKEIISEKDIEKLVVGLPKNMNGSLGPQGEKVLSFVKKLEEKMDIEIVLQDERLTTVAAEKMLIAADVSRKKRKKVIDKIAAVYILQGYLDSNK